MEVIFKCRKHWLWLPWSFTIYSMSADRLFIEKGLFTTTYDETQMFRITDVQVTRTLLQKMCGTGTVHVTCRDVNSPNIDLVNVPHPIEVKELLVEIVEKARKDNNVREVNYGAGFDIDTY